MTHYVPFPAQYSTLAHAPATILLQTSRFDEENYRSFLFCHPERVLSAERLDEVPGAFVQIEQALAQGAYVAGYLSYECGECFQDIESRRTPAGLPLLWLGVYPRAYVFNHREGRFDGATPVADGIASPASADPPFCIRNARFAIPESEYADKINAIREYIRAGDTYQVNFTDRLLFDFEGSPLAMFAALQKQQRASYNAYLNLGNAQIVSFSPELFFRIRNGRIITRPMKGTAPRGQTTWDDWAMAEWLRNDAKNRAENVMIVDLLRNDLGRLCEYGSVQADKLFAIEKYETLFQMTSTISGRLRPDVRYGDILKSLFPCGSITGAPKIRSMQLIQELEKSPRGVYTGAIGWIAPSGESAFSVAIRTAVLHGGRGQMGVGGGITYDSTAPDEYRECLLKTEFLSQLCSTDSDEPCRDSSPSCASGTSHKQPVPDFQLIESLLWNGRYPLLPLHLDRLQESASPFGFVFDRGLVRKNLERNQHQLQRGLCYKVRLLLEKSGAVTIENSVLQQSTQTCKVALSAVKTSSDDPFLRHKTTRRELYDSIFAAARRYGFDDVLFVNERGEITEGAISNVFIEVAGQLYTPPSTCGLLPGVYRRHVLETVPAAAEKVLLLSDLRSAKAIYLCNAVRGMRRAELDDTVRLHLDRRSH